VTVQRHEVLYWLGPVDLHADRAQRMAIADAIVASGSTDEATWRSSPRRAVREAELVAQVRRAERDMMEAVALSTIGSAWIRLQIAQMRLARQAQQTAAAAAGRIGASVENAPPVANRADAEQLTRAVDRAAARVVADETDAVDAAREQAGQG